MTEKSENITATQSNTGSKAEPETNAGNSAENNLETGSNKITKNNAQIQPSQSSNSTHSWRVMRVLIITSIIFLIVIIISGIVAVRYQQQTNHSLMTSFADLNNRINNLKHNEKIDDLSTAIKQTFDEHQISYKNLSNQIKQLQQQQSELSAQAELTQQHLRGDAHYWIQHEVMHLLRMASHRLALSHDAPGAIAALQTAEARITELNNPALLSITKSIQQQVKILSQLTVLDTSNLHMKIDAIRNELRVVLIDAPSHNHERSTPTNEISTQKHTSADISGQTTAEQALNASQSFLVKLIESAKALFNDSVQVTHGTQDSAEFLKQQNNRRTYEVVNIHLLEAQHAIVQRDNRTYKKHLDAAMQEINTHSGFQHQASISQNIQTLSEINLTPQLPDISQPRELLAEKIAQSKVSK